MIPRMTIRIVTDSTADLPTEYVERFNLTVVPLTVLFGDEELLDGIDITSEQFFRRMAREAAPPTTAQPSAGLFRQTYQRLIDQGATEILSIHISERISGTLESARQGAAGLSVPIRHVDSQQVSVGLAVGVIEAARAVEAGASFDLAREVAEDTFRRTKFFFTVDNLEHLRRGGRLTRGQEILGSLLKVKPVITFEHGEPVPVGRIRTKQKALESIVTRTAEMRPLSYTVAAHTTTPAELEYVANRLRGVAKDATQITSRLGPVLGVHGGPGVVGCGGVRAPDDRSPAFLRR
jgi:DegV family protein with EDD domain